jgi:hypothetical protein
MTFLKFKSYLKEKSDFLIPILIYFLILYLIYPFGEHAVNDDWQFYTHVRYFSEGNYVKNPLIDSSFILQGLLGVFWTSIFGLSFLSLRVLTIIFTVIFLTGVYKILKLYNVSKVTTILAFLAIFIEPLFLTSSFSFMTEIYFLTFCIWSIYFFIKGLKSQNLSIIYISILIGSMSLLIRQFGIVLLLGFLICLYKGIKDKKLKFKSMGLTILAFLLTSFILILFPQYSGEFSSKYDKMLGLFGSLDQLIIKITYYIKYLVYISFYLAPLTFAVALKNNKFKTLSYILSIFLAFIIFRIDIFDLGNVFHIECLYCELQFKNRVSLFDNVFFKIFLSYILALNLVLISFKIYEAKLLNNSKKLFNNPLLIFSLGMFFIIMFVDSFYERYFINFAIIFIIYVSILIDKFIKPDKFTWCISSLFLLIVVILNVDFYKSAEIKWQQSIYIRSLTGKNGEIFTLGSFYRFILAQETSPENLRSAVYIGKTDCYVKTYYSTERNFLGKILERQKYGVIENPVFSGEKFFIEIPKITKNMTNIVTFQEFESPVYNLLGIKTAIAGFCDSNVIEEKSIKTKDIKNFNF